MSSSSSDRDPVELLAEEFMTRKRRGEKPTLTEYVARHPHYAAEIRDLFPALLVMENLGESSQATTGPRITEPQTIRRLGEYRILREVGRGGMGVVYEAEQESLGRRVALKVLPPHALNEAQQIRRFEREAKAAAKLHHSNIVPVFGVGHQEGVHFYVMQFIQGLGLDNVLDELRQMRNVNAKQPEKREVAVVNVVVSPALQVAQSLVTCSFQGADPLPSGSSSSARLLAEVSPEQAGSTVDGFAADSSPTHRPDISDLSYVASSDNRYWRSVARIGVQVAEALDYAHAEGIHHRDIKPSNLLMDMKGTVWVTDFGLAKATDADDLTNTGDIVGTIRYMAPERFQGISDGRSDIYSLGLTLYEMLALRPAFQQRDRASLIQEVLHEDPPGLRKLNRAIPRDLETIVQKAIAKDPKQRYARASALASDLQCFLEDRPIKARRVSVAERFWRSCRRKPALASAIGLAVVALIAVTFISIYFAAFQSRSNHELSKVNDDLNDKQKKLENEQELTIREKQNAVDALNKQRRISVILATERARSLVEQHQPDHALLWLAHALEDAPEEAEDLQLSLRANLASIRPERYTPSTLPPSSPNRSLLAESPDGKWAVIRDFGKTIEYRVVDATTGKTVGEPLPFGSLSTTFVFFPDGKRFLSCEASGTPPKFEVRLWDTQTAKPHPLKRFHPNMLNVMTISPNGKLLTFSEWNNEVLNKNVRRICLWNAETLEPIVPFLDGGPQTMSGVVLQSIFSPDSSWLLTVYDREARIWDTASGKQLGEPILCNSTIKSAAVSPNGKQIALGMEDHSTLLWDVPSRKQVGSLMQNSYPVSRVVFSPDSRLLASLATTGILNGRLQRSEVRLWRTENAEPAGPISIPDDIPQELLFSPDGLKFVTVGVRDAQLWDVDSCKPIGKSVIHTQEGTRNNRIGPGIGSAVVFRSDGRSLVTLNGTWEIDVATPLPRILRHQDFVSAIAFSPDGSRLVTGTHRRGLSGSRYGYVWDRSTAQPVGEPLQHADGISVVAFSPDSRLVLTGAGAWDGTAQLWDAQTGLRHGPALDYGFGSAIYVGTFSQDGRTVLLGGYAKEHYETARMWDTATGKRVGAALAHKAAVKCLAYSGDGNRVVTGSEDNTAQLWDAHTGKPIGPPMLHAGKVESVAFSPDGRLVLTASLDKTARLWNGFTGESIRQMKHENGVAKAIFSPTGQTIFTASLDKTGRLWDTNTGVAIGLPWPHPAAVTCAAFSPDGKVVATGCEDRQARLWASETGMQIGQSLPHPRPVTAIAFSPEGETIATACDDEAARLWDVPAPIQGEGRRLVLWIQVETGMELDREGAIHILDRETLAARRLELERAGGPPTLAGTRATEIAERHRRIAEHAALQLHWEAVLWHTEKALALEPKHWPTWLRRGEGFFELGQTKEAAAAYAKAFQTGPKAQVLSACKLHVDKYENHPSRSRATVEEKKARWKLATAILDILIDACPDNWKLYDRRGKLLILLNRHDDAEADYRRALKLGPDMSFFYQYLGATQGEAGWALYHFGRSQWPEATHDYARLIELGCNAPGIENTNALLRLYAGDTDGYRQICKRFMVEDHKDWYVGALGSLGESCTIGPDAVEDMLQPIRLIERAVQEATFGHHFFGALGGAYYRAGRFEDAIACLNESLTGQVPQSVIPDSWIFLAMAHHRLGHTEEEKKWRNTIQEWLKKNQQPAEPGKPIAYNIMPQQKLYLEILGKELDNLDRWDAETLEKLTQAIDKARSDPKPLLTRGRFFANRGQWQKAEADFTQAVELQPKNPDLHEARGRFFAQWNQREKAAADFAEAALLSPDDLDARAIWVRGRAQVRVWKGVAEEYTPIVAQRPDDVALRLERGEAYLGSGRWADAVADFQVAVEKKPEEARNWYYLALAKLGANDRTGYRETCVAMDAKFATSPEKSNVARLFYTCVVTPDALPDMNGLADIARGFGILSRGGWSEIGGALLYRSGKYQETIQKFNKPGLGVPSTPPRPWDYFFLAMAHHRLGHAKEAADFLAKGESWMAAADKQEGGSLGGLRPAWEHWRERLMAQTLRREASELIRGKAD